MAETQPADQPHVHTETASAVAFFAGKVGVVSSTSSSRGVNVTPRGAQLVISGGTPTVTTSWPTLPQ